MTADQLVRMDQLLEGLQAGEALVITPAGDPYVCRRIANLYRAPGDILARCSFSGMWLVLDCGERGWRAGALVQELTISDHRNGRDIPSTDWALRFVFEPGFSNGPNLTPA